jgi:AcrR family transcriptional regulator
MPRIAAPTVAEHHRMRRASVVAAARTVLGNDGVPGVTPAAVARGAGLARSSVYQYYPSSAALLAAAVEAMFAEAAERIRDDLARADSPREQIRAYVRAAVTTATDRCGPFHGLTGLVLPEPCRARLRELHEQLAEPLRAAVATSGAPAPEITSALVLGAVASAANLVQNGHDLDDALARTLDFVENGLPGPG